MASFGKQALRTSLEFGLRKNEKLLFVGGQQQARNQIDPRRAVVSNLYRPVRSWQVDENRVHDLLDIGTPDFGQGETLRREDKFFALLAT